MVALLKLSEARQLVGREVVYTEKHTKKKEYGIITSVNDKYVFVKYGNDTIAKATKPQELEEV